MQHDQVARTTRQRGAMDLDVFPEAGEKRISSLFRRWPALDRMERLELRRLWRARMHAAKERGKRRRGRP